MAWFKLNDSLNTLKDQLSSVSHVVQEAFQEIPDDDADRDNASSGWRKFDELNTVCESQAKEIERLTKQIQNMQSITDLKKNKPQQDDSGTAATPLDDSWFWDTEQPTSAATSASSSAAASTSDALRESALKSVSLEKSNDSVELVENFRKVRIENAILNEKVVQLQDELRQSNVNLERLDGEHSIAIDEVLHLKSSLQRKCDALEQELTAMRAAEQERDLQLAAGPAEDNGDLAQLREELAKCAATNERLSNSVQRASEELSQRDERVRLLENSLSKSDDELKLKLIELNDVLAKFDETRTELAALSEHNCQLRSELEESYVRTDDELENVRRENGKLQTVLKALCDDGEKFERLNDIISTDEELFAERLSEVKRTEPSRAEAVSAEIHVEREPIPYDDLVDALRTYAPDVRERVLSAAELIGVLNDTLVRIDQCTFDLESMTEENHKLSERSKRLQRANDNAQADLHHYENELADVKRNNEKLLIQLDAMQSSLQQQLPGKLETIAEQNEDNLIDLEQQLEDCSNLNRSLEDEYDEMRQKLQEADERAAELVLQLAELEEVKSEISQRIDGLIEKHESELRSRTESDQLEIQHLQDERKQLLAEVESLRVQLTQKTDEHSCALSEHLAKVASLTEEHSAVKHSLEKTIENNIAHIAEHKEVLSKKSNDIDELIARLRTQQAEHEESVATLHKSLEESRLKANQSNMVDEATTVAQTAELVQVLAAAAEEKAKLVDLVTAKHSESLAYHEEIQRLNALLTESASRACEQQNEASQQLAALREHIQAAGEQAQLLRDKRDELAAALQAEQDGHQRTRAINEQLHTERLEVLADAQRLRSHLLEVEEMHTQESMELQANVDRLQLRNGELEQEVMQSSATRRVAQVRDNQQIETLQAQYALLEKQRDDYVARLSAAEDKESHNEAALINLQCALEQFQNNKERDVVERTQQLQRQLDASAAQQQSLSNEIDVLRQQLTESENGLLAAARITDQLEATQLANANLRDELRHMKQQHESVLKQSAAMANASADKVDRDLLKNLLIGFVAAPNAADKQQVLKLIASVLRFDGAESERVGLGGQQQSMGWLGAIRNAALVVGHSTSVSGSDPYNKEGIAQAFVRFLENESKPKPAASSAAGTATSLLSIGSTQTNAAQPPVALQSNSPSDASLLSENFAPVRNTSTILKDILNDS